MAERHPALAHLLCVAIAALTFGCGDDAKSGDGSAPAPTPTPGPTEPTPAPTSGDPIEALPIDETISLPGLGAEVDVVVDDNGTPHIYGPDTESVVFVQAYLMADQRFFMMDVLRRFAGGRLSELFGSLTLSTDVEMRTVFTARDGRRIQDALWERMQADDPVGAGQTAAFAAGVNAWLADLRAGRNGASLPPEYAFALIGLGADDLDEWRPEDTLALGRLQAWNLSNNTGTEIGRAARNAALDPDLNADVFRFAPATRARIQPPDEVAATAKRPPVAATAKIPADRLVAIAEMMDGLAAKMPFGAGDWVGSNNWIVSGDRTESGYPIMANDPHLQLFNPPIWWMSHLKAEGDGPGSDTYVNANGVIFPGLVGVILGHNEWGAWGATTSSWDVTDVYVEEITTPADYPASPRTVLWNGEQVPVLRLEEEFRVNRGETRVIPIEVVPHHGPQIPDPDLDDDESGIAATGMSFRWTGHEVSLDSVFLREIMQARNADEFREALSFFATGGQNWVWADVHGDIDWYPYVLVPERPAGVIPYLPVSGAGDADWRTDENGDPVWVEADRLPQSRNPASGIVVSANNDPNGNTFDNDPSNDDVYLGDSYAIGFRAERIERLLYDGDGLRDPGDGLTVEDMVRYQYDHQSLEASRFLPFLFDAAAARPDLVDAAMAEAIERLREWGVAKPGSAPGAVAWDMVSGVDAAEVRDDVPEREDPVSDEERADAVATSIYVAWTTRLPRLVLADEFAGTGIGRPGGSDASKALLHLLEDVDQTSDAFRVHTLGDDGQSHLWDDKTTEAVETRDEMLLAALAHALAFLEEQLSTADQDAWRWGLLHEARYQHFFGQGGLPIFDVFPVPAPGGRFTVNPASYSLNDDEYDFAGGPSMRHVVLLDPAGVRSVNVIPGGNNGDPGGVDNELYNTIDPSKDYGTHIPDWINGRVFDVRFHDAEVAQNARSKRRFTP